MLTKHIQRPAAPTNRLPATLPIPAVAYGVTATRPVLQRETCARPIGCATIMRGYLVARIVSHLAERLAITNSIPGSPIIEQLTNVLRQSPRVRSIVYFAGAVGLLEGIRPTVDFTRADAIPRLHLALFPFAMGWTTLISWLEGQPVSTVSLRQKLAQMLQGAALGSAAWLLVLGVLRRNDWVSIPCWGWELTSADSVARAVISLTIGHAAVACNEETLFRGYGFDTLRAALGTDGAATLLIPLFAVYHGTRPQVLAGMSIGGACFTLMRLTTGDIWLGLGYHWAWNVMQTAVYGPIDGLPSLRPIEVHGPPAWVGRPGQAEPGWVAILVSFGVTIFAASTWWSRRRRA
jgi:membrane protease YdiL (CAAX protease family)